MKKISLRQDLTKQELNKRKTKFNNFLDKLAHDKSCDEFIVTRQGKKVDVGLNNIYKDRNIIDNFPSLWTDWRNRLDSRILIFGQD